MGSFAVLVVSETPDANKERANKVQLEGAVRFSDVVLHYGKILRSDSQSFVLACFANSANTHVVKQGRKWSVSEH